jgi:hypothetical protein
MSSFKRLRCLATPGRSTKIPPSNAAFCLYANLVAGARSKLCEARALFHQSFGNVFSGGRRRTWVLALPRCLRTAYANSRPRSTSRDRAARSARVRHPSRQRLPDVREDAWLRKRRRAPACSLDPPGPATASSPIGHPSPAPRQINPPATSVRREACDMQWRLA